MHVPKALTNVYSLGNPLRKGAFAEVKKCERKATRQDRAVEIYHKDTSNPSLREKLMRKFNILRILHHPNVVDFEDEKKLYMVMKYCKGEEMFNIRVKGANTNEVMVARTAAGAASDCLYPR